MYLSLTIAFLLILGLVVAAIQNSTPVELKFITWKLQFSLMTLIFYASLVGGAVVALLTLPKLISKSLKVRRLNKEICDQNRKSVELEKGEEENS
ncbi:lipopolysaccharide assembly LapA domain-containing protein [Thermodesulfobacteriota bacterium]